MIIYGDKGFIGSHLLKMIERSGLSYVIYLYGKSDGNSKEELFRQIYTFKNYDLRFRRDNPRIIYASSIYVGHIENYYTLTKEYFEWMFKNFNATGLRFCGVYGKGGKGIINKLLDCALTEKPFIIRDIFIEKEFIFVTDACRWIIDSLDSSEKIIEAGSGQYMCVFDLINLIQEITGKKLNLIHDKNYNNSKPIFCKNQISNPISIPDGIAKLWKELSL